MIGSPVFGAFNIANGNDAEKPLSPAAGDQYLALDTGLTYVCFVAGTWKATNRPVYVYGTDVTLRSVATEYTQSGTSYATKFTDNYTLENQIAEIHVSADMKTSSTIAYGDLAIQVVKDGNIMLEDTLLLSAKNLTYATYTAGKTVNIMPGEITINYRLRYNYGSGTVSVKNLVIKANKI